MGIRKQDRPRFFVEGAHGVGDVVELAGADARKVRLVLRGRSGDPAEICDSSGRAFVARLETVDAVVTARLESLDEAPTESACEIVLCQAIPKGAKMDFVVEKATELGVARIVPVLTERTLATGGDGAKVERWRRLARTAAAQCGRSRIPTVDAPIRWADLVGGLRAAYDVALLPWELADRVPLRDVLPPLLEGVARIAVLVGPEGGISHDEAALAVAGGARPVSLGPRIFRTETAGLVVVSALLYALGEL